MLLHPSELAYVFKTTSPWQFKLEAMKYLTKGIDYGMSVSSDKNVIYSHMFGVHYSLGLEVVLIAIGFNYTH